MDAVGATTIRQLALDHRISPAKKGRLIAGFEAGESRPLLPSGNEVRVASEQLENDFAPGESSPINVVVQARGDILQLESWT